MGGEGAAFCDSICGISWGKGDGCKGEPLLKITEQEDFSSSEDEVGEGDSTL